MAKLTFDIPDARMPEVIEAFGRGRGWSPEFPDANGDMQPNPETEQHYAKEQIRQDIIRHVKHYQGSQIAEIPITTT